LFSINCVGKQPTLDDIRVEKNEKFKELANKRGTKEYDAWFLKYNPSGSKKSKSAKEPVEEDTEEADSPETPTSSDKTPKSKKAKKPKKTKKLQKAPTKTTTKHKRSKPKDAYQKLFSKSSNN